MGDNFNYPPILPEKKCEMGLYPVDFILESILKAGLKWFKEDADAKDKVFGHLRDPWLSKYGQSKIDEIYGFIVKYDIRVVQSWAQISAEVPTISIQLMDGYEMTERAGFGDFAGQIDVKNMENEVLGRKEVGYTPISDNVQLGIHSINGPDLAKYIYYLVIYILTSFRQELEARGLQLGTFRATDLSRMNEYLPENMYSRFINFTVFSIASFDKGAVPIIEKFMGVHVNPSDIEDVELGIKPVNIETKVEE